MMESGEALLKKLDGRLSGLRGRLTPDTGMDKITWFRAGGPAQVLFQPSDEEDLSAFLKAVPEEIPLLVVGIGSNLLVRDGGVPGFVVRLSAKGFGEVEQVCDTQLRAGRQRPTSAWPQQPSKRAWRAFISIMAFPAGSAGHCA